MPKVYDEQNQIVVAPVLDLVLEGIVSHEDVALLERVDAKRIADAKFDGVIGYNKTLEEITSLIILNLKIVEWLANIILSIFQCSSNDTNCAYVI